MKTIKQIADELGVNKQKVYRFIVKNHITASSEVKQSKLYDEAAERLIKSHFDRITTSCERSSEPHQKSGNEMLLEQLIKELEVKNEQLSEKDRQIREKDRQIAEMQAQLSKNQKLIDQEQQLRMVTERKFQLLEQQQKDQLCRGGVLCGADQGSPASQSSFAPADLSWGVYGYPAVYKRLAES